MPKTTLSYKTWVEIDRSAILSNVGAIQRAIGKNITLIAIIKANAYGHGLVEVAEILRAKKDILLGVDSIDEALALKKIGTKQPIMILGYIQKSRMLDALHGHFHISVYDVAVLKYVMSLLAMHRNIKPHLHLKIETGTNRLGVALRDLARIKQFPSIDGIYTHFADAENIHSRFYQEQSQILKKAIWILRRRGVEIQLAHAASSAALMLHADARFSAARLGISLYGLWPSPDVKHLVSDRISLKPALMWKTRIAQIREIQKGETVGYDRTWKAKKETTIAILPVGYYDGYDRGLSNCGVVLVHGKCAPVIGRICMNMMIVDMSGIAAHAGDEAILLGRSGRQEISADDIAKQAGTINYEIVSRINPLLPRIIV